MARESYDGPPVILTVPGWTGSGPEHWQSLWERRDERVRRVEMPDWERPRRTEWVGALSAAVSVSEGAVVLVAHSLGCLAVAHWAIADPEAAADVAGALLVAPPDVERADTPNEIGGFAPVPRRRLPFPSIVAGSTDDPWSAEELTRSLAADWGARYESLGAAGHVNTDAGYGPFRRGEALLEELVAGGVPPAGP